MENLDNITILNISTPVRVTVKELFNLFCKYVKHDYVDMNSFRKYLHDLDIEDDLLTDYIVDFCMDELPAYSISGNPNHTEAMAVNIIEALINGVIKLNSKACKIPLVLFDVYNDIELYGENAKYEPLMFDVLDVVIPYLKKIDYISYDDIKCSNKNRFVIVDSDDNVNVL